MAAREEEVTEQVGLFEFESTIVEEQLLSVLGASSLELDESVVLEQGDEVEIVLVGKVQQSRIATKQRGRRDGGREVTRVTRVVKVDQLSRVTARPKLVKS
jgi:hypothetical protein